jgi:selenocysteine lyase/cysteine desulfurase
MVEPLRRDRHRLPLVPLLQGEVVDVKEITRVIRERAPRAVSVKGQSTRDEAMVNDAGWRCQVVCVDGVAYAPHLAMDVSDWGVDFYVYSHYKVRRPRVSGPGTALALGVARR